MHEPEDDRMRALFQDVRHEEEPSAPRFQETWSAAQARRKGSSGRRMVWRWAVAAILVLVAGWWMTARHSESPHPQLAAAIAEATTLAEWRSPTHSLLHRPDQLLQRVPRLDDSVVDLTGLLPEPEGS